MVGFRRAGDILIEERAFLNRDVPVSVSSSGSYGLLLDIAVTQRFKFEILLSRQVGSFEDTDGLFGEQPGGFVEPGERDLLNVNVLHYHGGLVWELGRGSTREYIAAGAGVSRIEPSLPLPDEGRFSFNVGGGVKIRFAERIGLRLDARFFWADTNEEVTGTQDLRDVRPFEERDCQEDLPCTYTYRYEPSFSQMEVSLGLILIP
jgi:hypothetical protein